MPDFTDFHLLRLYRRSTIDVGQKTKHKQLHCSQAPASPRERKNEKGRPLSGTPQSRNLSALLAHLGKAIAAIHRTIALGLERHSGLAAAVGAGSGEVLPRTAGSVLAGVTAGLAALRLVLEAALRIELLLTGGEHELLAALFAH